VFACVLAACGGGGYSTQRIDTGGGLVITLPGGATTLTIVQPAPGQFSVAEAGYTGAFTATTANPAIAIIGVASVSVPHIARPTRTPRQPRKIP